MAAPPARPKVYHIVHLDRLPFILADGQLLSDARMASRPGRGTTIGMSAIKTRRLVLPVDCHPGTNVGEYVPFYFCPRSIMLYLIHMANHSELTYRGGQVPILHLEADLLEVVQWADEARRRWAFSLSNAGAYYAQFRGSLEHLGEIDWDGVFSTDFRRPEVKEGKQAEFLMHDVFPWHLVRRIGTCSLDVGRQVKQAMGGIGHRPKVETLPGWYY